MPSPKPPPDCDVCIVGAGPSGLVCSSAILEPYMIDHLNDAQRQRAAKSLKQNHHLRRNLRVCVLDPHPRWLDSFKTNFDRLNIQHLRSPAMGHPNMFDSRALLTYAHEHGRDKTELYESGCCHMKQLLGLGQTQVGLWKLPSTKLFFDFCNDMVDHLRHTYLQGQLTKLQSDVDHEGYRLHWTDASDGSLNILSARNVVLAMGAVGQEVVPRGLTGCPKTVSWNSHQAFGTKKKDEKPLHVLVVGGGLTAAQAALRVVQDGHKCVLCSRRALREKHFDIGVDWFDRRTTHHRLSIFYHDTMEQRLCQLKEARDGGSVPAMYLKRLKEQKQKGLLDCWVGEVQHVPRRDNDTGVTILYQGKEYQFEKIILACGVALNCKSHPLMAQILDRWPIPVHGGFPDVTQDLRWTDESGIFVTGALAALQVGPDAGNLMGMRRAATVIARALDCQVWLRETALANPFEALWDDDDDTTESEAESEDECSSCCHHDDESIYE